MKYPLRIVCAILLFLIINRVQSPVFAQGTAFTYQGRLENNGALANGTYNLQFSLYATNTGGTAVAGPVTNSAVAVTNGLFTVIIDFGSSVWNGQTNWLQIGVETNNATSFTSLAPRQQVTPTPCAINAEGLSGTLQASQLASIGNSSGGNDNFFVGPAGSGTTSGFWNTALGVLAITNDTTGNWNTAIGGGALRFNTSGTLNTGLGSGVLSDNRTGNNNTAIGGDALDNLGFTGNAGGTNNIALGFNAGSAFTANESSNIDIGNVGVSGESDTIRIGTPGVQTNTWIAGVINGNGSGLTNINAGQLTSGGSNVFYSSVSPANLFIGHGAGNPATDAGDANIAIGLLALRVNSSGGDNTAIGYNALYYNTNGFGNTAYGPEALYDDTSGAENTGVGVAALYDNATGSNNVAVGFAAGENIVAGSYNIDIGNVGVFGESGVVRIGTAGQQTATYLVGNVYTPSGTVQSSSDRNAKEDFAAVNPQQVLAKVATLPVTEWNYKTDKGVEHIGPMAQDFHAAFGLNGEDDKHISVVDEGGVALAAIQGLNEKLAAENREKDSEIQQLQQSVAQLQATVSALTQKRSR